jgi:hypothetical protein
MMGLVGGGGSKESFVKRIQDLDNNVKWRCARQFISYNTSWQTKLIMLPVDGMHRCALSSSVLNGIPPPDVDEHLKATVQEFSMRLSHVGKSLAIRRLYVRWGGYRHED